MKKFNSFNYHSVLLGIILPILIFFVSMNATYAYYTAKAGNVSDTVTVGTIQIKFSDTVIEKVNSVVATESTKIQPGDSISINAELQNIGNNDVYCIFEIETTITKSGETESEFVDKVIYTYSGSNLRILAENTDGTFTYSAFKLTKASTKNVSVSFSLNPNEYGNEYKNATLNYIIKAYAVQTANIDPADATSLLYQNATSITE